MRVVFTISNLNYLDSISDYLGFNYIYPTCFSVCLKQAGHKTKKNEP